MSNDLGDGVTEARKNKGWSRQDLHRVSGVSYPYISQIETGDRMPSLNTIRRLADALDLPVSQLAALVAPDAWAGSSSLAMSPSAQQDWMMSPSVSAPAPSRLRSSRVVEPPIDKTKDAVRRRLRDLSPAAQLQVLAELTVEIARELGDAND